MEKRKLGLTLVLSKQAAALLDAQDNKTQFIQAIIEQGAKYDLLLEQQQRILALLEAQTKASSTCPNVQTNAQIQGKQLETTSDIDVDTMALFLEIIEGYQQYTEQLTSRIDELFPHAKKASPELFGKNSKGKLSTLIKGAAWQLYETLLAKLVKK